MELRFELALECGEDTLQVRRFDVHEELSHPWEVHLLARSPKPEIDLEAIVGKPARFVLASDNPEFSAPVRAWAGVCSHAEQLVAEKEERGVGLSTYRFELRPMLWQLTHNQEHRIFQRLTLPEIVQKILDEREVEYDLKLLEEYKKADYIVQYGESDFEFVSRLLERAGITYYFHFDDATAGKLTLSDQPHNHPPRASITFNPKPEGSPEHFNKVRLAEHVAPGSAAVVDFDFRRPDYKLLGEPKKAAAPEDKYEQYWYLPGAALYIDPAGPGSTPVADDKGKVRSVDAENKSRAERRLQAERCRKRLVGFETNVLDTFPGVVLCIDEHPRAELAKPLLVTALSLEGSLNESWTNVGEAVFAQEPYRPFEHTAQPRICGVQSAVVVGPPGEEIYTDEYGRVRVQFHWDREGKVNDESSCWMRVSQGWAGTGFGRMMIPRIDQEVLVSFFEGDPDRPVVVGRAHNATNTLPKENELPRYKTRTSWMSDTSPHDGGFNVIRFEDAKDQEYVFIQAQRDQQTLVKRHETERTGQNRATVVGQSRSAVVGEVDAVLVGKKYSLQMIELPAAEHLKILRLGKPDVSPLSTKLEMVDKNILCTTGEATAVMSGADITFEAKKEISFKAGGNIIVKGGPNIHINPSGGGSAQAGCLATSSDSGAPFVEKAK